MKRIEIIPRLDWQRAVESLGMSYHTDEKGIYWNESVCYQFPPDEIEKIKAATRELWSMCMYATDFVIKKKLFELFDIPVGAIPLIIKSWTRADFKLYGRFDLSMRDGQIKMLEFNGDTPTALLEASLVQQDWVKKINKPGQFNDIYEELKRTFSDIRIKTGGSKIYFSCLESKQEDYQTTLLLMRAADYAGIHTQFIDINSINWSTHNQCFVDDNENRIDYLYKLAPYDMIFASKSASQFYQDNCRTQWIEPPWKIITSSKGLLPILWKLFPDSPYLLESYFDSPKKMQSYVSKPQVSRTGLNVSVVIDGQEKEKTDGCFLSEKRVYQKLWLPEPHNGYYPVIGSWLIGNIPAGMGIRESKELITKDSSQFIPHYVL